MRNGGRLNEKHVGFKGQVVWEGGETSETEETLKSRVPE